MTTALVTGAASGIGAAVADRFRTDGFDVVGIDITEAAPPDHGPRETSRPDPMED